MAQTPVYQAPRGYPPPPWKPRGTKVLSRSLNTTPLYILYLSACSSSYSDYIVFFDAPQVGNKNFIHPQEKKPHSQHGKASYFVTNKKRTRIKCKINICKDYSTEG